MTDKYALWTNDVETHSIWLNDLNVETGRRVVEQGIPILLDLYDRYSIKSTFFFNCDIAQHHPESVREVYNRGHEIGSHGLTHEKSSSFDNLDYAHQLDHLRISKEILEDAIGDQIVSFRAPALRVNEHTPRALKETGYLIDSSVASQRFDFFLSFGGVKKLKWLTAPRKAYKTKNDDLTKRGTDGVIEVPLSALFFPYVGTLMRINPSLTKVIRLLLSAEQSIRSSQVVFDIHPNEFIDESDRTRMISRRSDSFIQYLLADVLRSKMKIKNLGYPCESIYANNIDYFKHQGYRSVTIKQFCKERGLLL